MVEVIYVDYGNYELLFLSRLCMLRKDYVELFMMVIFCVLEGVVLLNGVRYEDIKC